jgi:hypothetical protein
MRTTVEIDDDLGLALRDHVHRDGGSLRQALNAALRRGLKVSRQARPAPRYRCPAVHMGETVSQSINLDKALALAGAMDDAETARELELRK